MRLELEVHETEDNTELRQESEEQICELTPAALRKAMMPGFDLRQAVRIIRGIDPFDSSQDDELHSLINRAELIAGRGDFQKALRRLRDKWIARNEGHPLFDRLVRIVFLYETFSRAMEKRDYSNALRAISESRREADDMKAERLTGSTHEKLVAALGESLDKVEDPATRVRLIRDFILKPGEERD